MSTPPSPGLRVRKLADRSEGERIVRYDPETGEKKLVNPHTEGDAHEPWPLLGLVIEGDPPATCRVPMSFVQLGVDEGWIELDNPRPAHRPGGPPANPWKVTHTFIHADAIVLKTIDGDVRYRVTHQPDKYVDGNDAAELVTDEKYAAGDTRVDWFYGVALEG